MRQVKKEELTVKAKRTDNGEWVYGAAISIGDKTFLICSAETSCMDGENTDLYATEWYEVDEATICHCLGEEYMDGDIAWEGDIFESKHCGVIMVLRYGMYEAYCPADKCFMVNVGFYAEAVDYPQMPIGYLKDYALKKGNVFDNPKLLQGGDTNEED